MDPYYLASTVQAWHTLSYLVPTEHYLNTTPYRSIVADHLFMSRVNLSSDACFQQDNTPCLKAQLISNWFLEHENELTVLRWPPESADLQAWDVVQL